MLDRVRKSVLLAAPLALALAACADSAETGGSEGPAIVEVSEPVEPEPVARIVLSETAWLSVSRDGAVFTTFLDPDGRYRDLRNGETIYSGSWFETPAGELCFQPDTGGAGCWAIGAPGDDRMVRATDGKGRDIALRRIAYAPPRRDPDPGSDAADAADGGSDPG
jgi:hypothetical protein